MVFEETKQVAFNELKNRLRIGKESDLHVIQ